MKRTRFQRLLALMLCLLVVAGGSSVTAAALDDDSTVGSDSIYDSSEVFETLGTMSYGDYLKEANAEMAKDSIVVDAVSEEFYYEDGSSFKLADIVGTYGGEEAIMTPSTGTVAWKVTIPEKALYNVTVTYYAHVDSDDAKKADSIERVFKINGKVPFSEARSLTIKKNWVNEYPEAVYYGKEDWKTLIRDAEEIGLKGKEVTDPKTGAKSLRFEYPDVWTSDITAFCDKHDLRFMKLDIYQNEMRPDAKQDPVWSEYILSDSMGIYTEPFTFVFEKGVNTISLDGKNSNLAIKEIILSPAEKAKTYKDYEDDLRTKDALKPGTGTIRIEAEYTANASDKTIYPIEEAADALTSPHSADKTYLNTMGGEKWQTAGQWVTYKFKVDKSGMYDIVSRFKQNVLDGMFVNRALYIYGGEDEGLEEGDIGYYNGIPFEEAKSLTYNFGEKWQVTRVNDGEKDYPIYFKEGVTYTLKFEVTLGAMADIINTVQASLDSINSDYLSIIQLTGSTPDTYRDYGFSRIMPDVLIDMVVQAKILSNESDNEAEWGVAEKLTDLAGEKSSNVATLQKVSELLIQMGKDEDEIARLLERLKSYIGTLGTFLSSAKTQPLQLDYIQIQPAKAEMPDAEANWWDSFVHEVSRFFASFFRDYDAVGVTEIPEEGTEALEVWLATGRDQFQVKRNLVNSGFVHDEDRDHDISVELKLVAAGTLLPSILAGQGPDVYHGLDQGTVINYAIRNAILPINYVEGVSEDKQGFEDFDEAAKSFNEAAMIVLAMEDSDGVTRYYGLPESQGFVMMYVRTDILADLDIEIPRTWDDIMAAIPKLQAKNMQMGLSNDSTIHLYQMGGELFADNGMRINLDSQVGLAAFQKTCDLFTKYGFPYTYDAANRFRTGEMPIIIADYTALYNQLKVFATEIEGSWAMVPVPGVEQEDGSINNMAISSATASIIVKGAENKKDDSWAYIKWFTGSECQAEYSNEMVALLGPSAKYNTANIDALERLPWTNEELQRIRAQFNNLASVPNYPGRYIIARYTEFAFLAAYNDNEDPQQAIRSHITAINKEITRKRAEFGLETLEQGQTLAQKRLDQATAAAELLAERDASKYGTLKEDVVYASKLKDSVTLHILADDILTMEQVTEDSSLKITKNPDISEFSDSKLLYYIAVAIEDAAEALLTY